jgi:preprotein translocase subunit SecD
MARRNGLVFGILVIVFLMLLMVVLPIGKGLIGGRGVKLGLDLQGGTRIVYQADLSSVKPGEETGAIQGSIAVLSNRVNPLGVSEPSIRKLGNDRIVVELPGNTLTDKEKQDLSRVTILEFGELVTNNGTAKWDDALGKWKPATALLNGVETELTSRYFQDNTYVTTDSFGRPRLVFNWDSEGSILSKEITTRLLGQPLGIFDGDVPLLGEDNRPVAPTVQATIVESGEITGLSYAEATLLSQQLNAGRLPVPLKIIKDDSLEPSLGFDFVNLSLKGGLIGIAIVMLFMIIYYRVPGFLASMALIFYAVLNMALYKLIPVTLSLAGLAGFIVSLGMAVDANVLIFERMKEELWTGRTLGAAIEAGFNRAWSAIWDSNATTFIACIILYFMGSAFSPEVQGFALTLFIGVAVSMFTAIVVTRTLLRLFPGTGLAKNIRLFSPQPGGKS